MLKNTTSSYGLISKIFHWGMAVIILTMLAVGYYMTSLPASPEKFDIYRMHKAFGVIALTLTLMRLIWKFSNVSVKEPKGLSFILVIGAKLGHLALYLLMLFIPVSGIFMSLFSAKDISVFGLFTINSFEKNPELAKIFNEIHETSAVILVAVIALHAVAALFHHFVLKDEVFKRMI